MSSDNNKKLSFDDLHLAGHEEFKPAVDMILASLEHPPAIEGVFGAIVNPEDVTQNEAFRVLHCPISFTTNTLADAIAGAVKGRDLQLPSDLWVIQLGRVGYRSDTQRTYKILRRVDFPLVFPVENDNTSFRWQLFGVATHRGRTTDAGEISAWFRMTRSEQNSAWVRMNADSADDAQNEVKCIHNDLDIFALAGGGDWHTACYLFYRKVDLL